MWNLYGKQYNLTSFAKTHPGGSEIIEKTKDLSDCTALFESYHAFSNIEGFRQTLAKYEVPNESGSAPVAYQQDFTTYRELVARVKTLYKTRESIKAPLHWHIWTGLLGFSYFYFMWRALFANYMLSRAFFVLAGIFTESSFLFNVLHDASHYAVSTDPRVNNMVSRASTSWVGWNHVLWLYHHVYYHHSYTGGKLDPDHKLYHVEHYIKFPEYSVLVLYCVFPGQFVGQGLWYVYTAFVGKLVFKSCPPLPLPESNYYQPADVFIIACKLALLYNLGWVSSILYLVTGNTLYFINIIGDHDLYETHENNYDGNDWALRQIRNSGNFANDNLLWTRWFGGINYQIEHHLFPNMCNLHYSEIAPIVEAFCLERGIPYVKKATVEDVYRSFMKKTRIN